MAITMKKITLWRKEVYNQPGALAETLAQLAQVHTDLQTVMGYRFPGDQAKAAIELHPVSGKKAMEAAQAGGLAASSIATLLVQGDNRAGLGHAIAKALGDAGTFVHPFVFARGESELLNGFADVGGHA